MHRLRPVHLTPPGPSQQACKLSPVVHAAFAVQDQSLVGSLCDCSCRAYWGRQPFQQSEEQWAGEGKQLQAVTGDAGQAVREGAGVVGQDWGVNFLGQEGRARAGAQKQTWGKETGRVSMQRRDGNSKERRQQAKGRYNQSWGQNRVGVRQPFILTGKSWVKRMPCEARVLEAAAAWRAGWRAATCRCLLTLRSSAADTARSAAPIAAARFRPGRLQAGSPPPQAPACADPARR